MPFAAVPFQDRRQRLPPRATPLALAQRHERFLVAAEYHERETIEMGGVFVGSHLMVAVQRSLGQNLKPAIARFLRRATARCSMPAS